MKGAKMEVFIHDKNKKAYYVFPLGYTPVSAINDVAKEKHINPDRLEAVLGWVKDDELFLEHKKGAEKVLVEKQAGIYCECEIDGHYIGYVACFESVCDKYRAEIELQKQEPCPNVISRSDMLDAIGHGTTYTSEDLQKIIKGLPSVNPQPKMGKWIEERTYMECPNCHDIWHYEENQTERFMCCPTCGERIK